jgi:hypothetical protein
MRDRIWAEYVPGQEITKTPTGDYLSAATEAIRYWISKLPATDPLRAT